MKALTLIINLLLATPLFSKEVYYELNISYFDGAPDGVPKPILGINGQFPGPTLRAQRYDWLTVKVTNSIQDGQSTTIHWHGIEQYLSPWEDGPRMLMQCDIPQNASFEYSFQVNQTGTYWYHSHHTGQYAEGLWGVLIVDNTPEVHNYDGEFVLTLSDWYHLPTHDMTEWYTNTSLSKGQIPYPDSTLINGHGYYSCEYAAQKNVDCDSSLEEKYKLFEVERGKTYRFRIVNPSTIVMHRFSIDGHQIEAIETDGVDTVRVAPVDYATISTGTRSSYLVTMNGDLDQYWIRSNVDLLPYKLDPNHPNINPFPEALKERSTTLAVLRYKEPTSPSLSETMPAINPQGVQGRPETHDRSAIDFIRAGGNMKTLMSSHERVDGFSFYSSDPVKDVPWASPPFPTTEGIPLDEAIRLNLRECHPFSGERAPDWVNQTIHIFIPDTDHIDMTHKIGFNNVTYDLAGLEKPAFFKMLADEDLPASMNPIKINGFGPEYVVQLIIDDHGDSGHPLHMHGHTFWVMGLGELLAGPYVEERDRPFLRSGVRRETVAVPDGSWLVLRFRADNPGLWLFHCHMNFHFEAALGLVLLEGGEVEKDMYSKSVPQKIKDLCTLNGIDLDDNDVSTTPNMASKGVLSMVTLLHTFIVHYVVNSVV